jgi:PAS domain S-box-containing protein
VSRRAAGLPERRPAAGEARERARLDSELLIESGSVLAGSLDPLATMRQVAALAVPRLADLCVIDAREEDGSITGVAVAAAAAGMAEALEDLRTRYPLDPASEHPVARVLRSGSAELLPEVPSGALFKFARSGEHAAFMAAHDYRSIIVAPLVANARILGALSVLRLGECVPYDHHDLELVIEIARRAALAIDNARLYTELRAAEGRLEAVFASVAEAITVVGEDGRMILANQAAADLLGYATPEALMGGEPGDVIANFHVRDERGVELRLEQMPGRRLLRGEQAGPLLVQNVVRSTGEERWLIVRSSPVLDPATADVRFVVNVYENITDLKRAELGERFMSEASRLLVSSMDYRETLAQIARLAVPQLADWCAIDLLREGRLERIALAAIEPATSAASTEDGALDEVLRTGRSHVAEEAGATVMILPVLGAASAIGAVSLGTRRRTPERDVALVERLARRIGTAVESARLYAERSDIARTLQRALLPSSLPEIAGAEIDARYLAAAGEIGGDFYDVIERDGDWLVVIGDVCGKGTRAAAVTALARHTLRAAAIIGRTPAEMLETLHASLRRHSPAAELCTACVVALSPDGDGAEVEVALAGHPRPVAVDCDGTARALGHHGTVLGVSGAAAPGLERVRLARGETLVLYTDGVLDAGRPDDDIGEDGLLAACRGAHAETVSDVLERLEALAFDRAAGRPRDDIALVGVRLR